MQQRESQSIQSGGMRWHRMLSWENILFSLNFPLRLPVGLIALYVKTMLPSNELQTDAEHCYRQPLPGFNDAQ